MHREELEQTAAPARTLAVQNLQGRRTFCPAAGFGNLDHTVFLTCIAGITDHAGQHIHILGKGVTVVATCLDNDIGIEHTEAAGHVLHGVDVAQGGFTNHEGTGVLQVLEQGDEVVRRMRLHHLTFFYDTAVTHTHGCTHSNHAARTGHGGPDHSIQSVLLQHAVHVGAHEELVGHHVDACVGSIGLCTAVHLVHHREALERGIVALSLVRALERLGFNLLYIRIRHLHQVEVLDEQVQGLVLGTVVHNDHLEVRIVQAKQGQHVGDHGLFLVVGRSHNGDTGRVGRLLQFADGVIIVVMGIVLLVLQESHEGKEHITEDHHAGIHDDKVLEKVVNPLRHTCGYQ